MAFCMDCGGHEVVLDISSRKAPGGGYPIKGVKPCPTCAPRPVDVQVKREIKMPTAGGKTRSKK